ncbi:MAG: hypothetical protein AAGD35_09295 [Actinomycetota bacterium]
MTTTSDATPDSPESPDVPPPRTLLGNIGRGLAVLVVLSSFLIWIYAYSGAAERDAPDLISDGAFARRAEVLCAEALADIDEMPDALDAVDGPDRAGQIRANTARFETMLDEITEAVPTLASSARDTEIATGWLSDWRVIIGDRYDYAERIAVDDQAQFYITDTGVNERLDRRITRLANRNLMPSCVAPTDVG